MRRIVEPVTPEEFEKTINDLLDLGDPSEENQDNIYALGMIQVIRKKLDEIEQEIIREIEL